MNNEEIEYLENDKILVNEYILDKNHRIIGYLGDDDKVVIPRIIAGKQVTGISYFAFTFSNLLHITIPEGITIIEPFTFRDNQLIQVSIPDSVTEIHGQAFVNNKINRISIGANVSLLSIHELQIAEWKNEGIPKSIINEMTKNGIDFNPDGIPGVFDNNFDEFYEINSKKAGMYTYDGKSWSYENID